MTGSFTRLRGRLVYGNPRHRVIFTRERTRDTGSSGLRRPREAGAVTPLPGHPETFHTSCTPYIYIL